MQLLNAKSIYGKSKYLTESAIMKNSGIIIKPGLIYGDRKIKGLTSKIFDFTERYGLAPNFINLNSNIYLTHIQDLCFVIKEILLNENNGVFLCANSNPFTFKELVLKFAFSKKVLLIPVLWQFLYVLAKVLEFNKIKISYKSDSILSLAKQNPNPKKNISLEYTKYFRD